MDMKKWIPWNWFKKEEEEAGHSVPVRREPSGGHGILTVKMPRKALPKGDVKRIEVKSA